MIPKTVHIPLVVLLICMLFSGNLFADDYTITAKIDQTVCSVHEQLTYEVTIEGKSDLPDLETPDFRDFRVDMGPSTTSSFQMINGRISREKSYVWVIRPKKEGRIIIPPAKAKHRSQVFKSNSIEIDVVPPGKPPTSSSHSSSGSQFDSRRSLPDVFLVAKVDKDTVYLRDMVTVEYDLYFKRDVRRYGFPNLPNLRGFWQEEFRIPRQPPVHQERVRGVNYNVATLRKVGLFPTRTGTLTIEPLTADITVEVPRNKRRRSVFDDPFFTRNRTKNESVTTEGIELTVLPFPNKGKPSNFKGDVGSYRLYVDMDSREVAQHDALNITVKISGTGYIKSISAPELELPDGFEQFDPTVSENVSTSRDKMTGRLEFNYLIIPRRSGTFNLEPVEFSFFDPDEKEYKTLRSGGGLLTVTPAEDDEYAGSSGKIPERIALLGKDIRFLKEQTSPLIKRTKPPYYSAWFYFSVLIFPLLFLFGLGTEKVVSHRMSDPQLVRLRRAPELMRKDLQEAQKLSDQNNIVEAFTLASKGLAEMVGALIREPAAGLTAPIVEKGLQELKVEETHIDEVKNLLSKADEVRFSGVKLGESETKEIINRYRQILGVLEKVRW